MSIKWFQKSNERADRERERDRERDEIEMQEQWDIVVQI